MRTLPVWRCGRWPRKLKKRFPLVNGRPVAGWEQAYRILGQTQMPRLEQAPHFAAVFLPVPEERIRRVYGGNVFMASPKFNAQLEALVYGEEP